MLKQAKDNQLCCGYCGKRYWKNETELIYCDQCIHSEYLTLDNLFLLELKPVSFDGDRSKLIPDSLKSEYDKRVVALEIARIERLKNKAISIRADFNEEEEE